MPQNADNPPKTGEGGGGRCPLCGKPRAQEYRPFCSKRCADIDLGRWLKGRYVIAGDADADEDGDAGAAGGDGEAVPGSDTPRF